MIPFPWQRSRSEALHPQPPACTAERPPAAVAGPTAVAPTSWSGRVLARAPHRILAGLRLTRRALPYQRQLARAPRSVLIVGDSTGVGAGAREPHDTVAGFLAHDFPHVSVVNRARHGARCRDVPAQLAHEQRFDAVLLFVGGNDVLRGTPADELKRHIAAALDSAKRVARQVVFVSTPDVGRAPLFPWPLSAVLSRRTRTAGDVFIAAARQAGATYIDLLAEGHSERFARDPQRYFAPDGLHPSTDSYRYCYRLVLERTPLRAALAVLD